MFHILFLIRSFDLGGAERQLIELVKGIDPTHFAATVVTFYDGGALWSEIEAVTGVRLVSLRKQGRWDVLPFLQRLWRVVREARPDILHGYMGVANELCLFLGKILGIPVVWSLRSSDLDFSKYDWATWWSFRVGAWLSRFADLIIVNSQAGRRDHVAHGYFGERMVVIPNGIDTERYRPNREAGRRVRAEWGVGESETLIGLVGRLDPMKDHPTFLRAASLLAPKRPDLRFVCVGDGPAPYRQELLALSESLRLGERLIWAGTRRDMPAVYNALDIATSSSSYGEGFPNVIGEAMACSIPCVVTDVGDSSDIVGSAGKVVPPRNPEALAEGWAEMLSWPPATRDWDGQQARGRIIQQFEAKSLVNRVSQALAALVSEASV